MIASVLRRLAALALVAASLWSASPQAMAVEPFYAASALELEGPPGSIIRVQPWPVEGIYRANIYRILYRSRGLRNEPIAVSASVIVPQFAVPPGGRPVIAWAHPTTGVATQCAPTLSETPFNSIAGLTQFVADGAVVVATDYPGLGTAGIHPYLIGESEGRAVLDSIRAVRQMPEAAAGPLAALWGHSQGGQAVLWAGQIQPSYAPEVKLAGIAAAAPASNLAGLLDNDAPTIDGKILVALALHSWSKLFGYSVQSIIEPNDVPAIEQAGRDCVDITSSALAALQSVSAINGVYLKRNPAVTPPWSETIAANSAGRAPIAAPLFIAQGDSDAVVEPKVTQAYVQGLCGRGEQVNLLMMRGVDHGKAAWQAASQANTWIMNRFYGRPLYGACR
ncbi:MAG: lipase family protein [Hyphomicrobiales bacterium]